jgi:hypothetical protein
MKLEELRKELNESHPDVEDVLFLDDKNRLYDIGLGYLHILGQPDYTTVIITKEDRFEKEEK